MIVAHEEVKAGEEPWVVSHSFEDSVDFGDGVGILLGDSIELLIVDAHPGSECSFCGFLRYDDDW